MRQTIRHPTHDAERDGSAGFVIGAVVCAAIMVALFALHGTPDLLAGKVPALAPLAYQSP